MSVYNTHSARGSEGRGEVIGPALRALRFHRLVAGAVLAAAVLGALFYVSARTREYQATAELLVSPLPSTDVSFQGLPVVRDVGGDNVRTLQTAAVLVDSHAAQQLTATRLGHGWTAPRVHSAVNVTPLGQSNILSVTATASNARFAATLADDFVAASLDAHTAALRGLVADQINLVRSQLAALGPSAASATPTTTTPRAAGTAPRAAIPSTAPANVLAGRLNQLTTLSGGVDPTLSAFQHATVPSSPSGTPASLIVALALVAGAVLAVGVVLLLEQLDPRLGNDDDLQEIMPAPVLARIPRQRQSVPAHGGRIRMPASAQEGFQAVRLLIERDGRSHRTVMVASASSRDGKTSSVIQFALSLTAAGQRVIILDLDLRKPDLSRALGVPTGPPLASVLETPRQLAGALVGAPTAPLLQVLSPEHGSNRTLIEDLGARLPDLLSEARSLADYVLIDTAPLGEVSDGLRIARHVDDILLVVRMGNTRYAKLEVASEMLGQLGSHPTGIVVIGGGPKIARGYAHPASSRAEREHRFPGGDGHRTSNSKQPAAKENRAPYQRRER